MRTFTLVKKDLTEKTGLPVTHPLVKFAKSPENIECALSLDTCNLGRALPHVDAEDVCISMLARRMRDRKLYKCIDVRAK